MLTCTPASWVTVIEPIDNTQSHSTVITSLSFKWILYHKCFKFFFEFQTSYSAQQLTRIPVDVIRDRAESLSGGKDLVYLVFYTLIFLLSSSRISFFDLCAWCCQNTMPEHKICVTNLTMLNNIYLYRDLERHFGCLPLAKNSKNFFCKTNRTVVFAENLQG